MKLRAVTPEDSAAMAELHRACLPQNWTADDFRAWLERPEYRLLLVEENSVLLGYAVARILSPEAEIITLAVAYEHRRRGVARALMEALMGEGDAETWFLEVSSGNAPAHALYAALGFKETGRRARYYVNGTDAVVMGRRAAAPERERSL